MRIVNLTGASRTYTSNVYLVTGSFNTLSDVNTLIDAGRDPAVIDRIRSASTGVGKRRLDQVILTHSHYDHVSCLPQIRAEFHPTVYAFSDFLDGVDVSLHGGEHLKAGEVTLEVIHTPGHSHDSICLYGEADGVLFAGDSPLIIRSPGGTYEAQFVRALEKICRKDVRTIYFGHGAPVREDCNRLLWLSLDHVRESTIVG